MPPRRRPTAKILTTAGWAGLIGMTVLGLAAVFAATRGLF